MTIYDLLRKFVGGGSWTEADRRAAEQLIEELEEKAAFGTTFLETTTEPEPEL